MINEILEDIKLNGPVIRIDEEDDFEKHELIKSLTDFFNDENVIYLDDYRVFNKKYLLLINSTCEGYTVEFETIVNIRFELDETVSCIESDISELEVEKNTYLDRIRKLTRSVK